MIQPRDIKDGLIEKLEGSYIEQEVSNSSETL